MEQNQTMEVLQRLDAIEDYAEDASARAAGLTWMVWGLAFSASILTAAPGLGWSLVVAFVPLVAAAVVTRFVWTSHASEPRTRIPVPWSLAAWAALAPILGVLAVLVLIVLALAATMAAAALGVGSHWSYAASNPLPGLALWTLIFAHGPWAFPKASAAHGRCLALGLFLAGLLEPAAVAAGLGERYVAQTAAVLGLAGFLVVGNLVYRRG